jgi:endonuclease YncB( thermonuclease family)
LGRNPSFARSKADAILASEQNIENNPMQSNSNGPATVAALTDADTVVIDGKSIRLVVDAPESVQICLDKNSEYLNCGIEARDALVKQFVPDDRQKDLRSHARNVLRR